jgi:DNA (cytosine-5)-methyltransferase 1
VRAIDLFSGFGGFTLAAQRAGVHVVWAANHWRLAVETHAANHPDVAHACQDLRQANWTELPAYDLLLASPACQGHSTASQPKRRVYHDAMRATAWAVVDCADVTQPKALLVENVTDFRRWRLYPLWRAALERLGYVLTEFVVRASEHGVPQRRERLFIAGARCRLDRLEPSPGSEPAFGPCVDWDTGAWRPVSRAAPGASIRIEAGRRLGDRFLVQHTTGHRGIPLTEPIRTITTKDHWIVVDGDRYRPLTLRELARGMGFPESYKWPDSVPRSAAVRGLGNAVCPPAAEPLIRRLREAA